jgi:L-alanine-DL-glutamate epimerase-like enolase superfamily enzyme
VGQGSPTIDRLSVRVFRIPTDEPEADGTISWESTTMVLVEAAGGGTKGIGYSYASSAAATLIADLLRRLVEGRNIFAVPAAWPVMVSAVRNVGWPGIAACAISAVDTALWDLKARVLELPLCDLLARNATSCRSMAAGVSLSIRRLMWRNSFRAGSTRAVAGRSR